MHIIYLVLSMLGMLSIIAGISFLGINIIYFSLKRNITEIKIEVGDTLPIIAELAGCKIEEIISLNKLKQPYKLIPGQRIKVISNHREADCIKNASSIQSAHGVKSTVVTELPESLSVVRDACIVRLHWPFYKLSFRDISSMGSLLDRHWIKLSLPITSLKAADNEIRAPFAGRIHNFVINNSKRVVLCSENGRIKLILDDVDEVLAIDDSLAVEGQKIARWRLQNNRWQIFVHYTQDGCPKDFLRVLCKKYIKLS